MLEDFAPLVLPVHIHFLFQERIEIPLGPRKALCDYHLPATLLDAPKEPLIIRVEAVGLLGGCN